MEDVRVPVEIAIYILAVGFMYPLQKAEGKRSLFLGSYFRYIMEEESAKLDTEGKQYLEQVQAVVTNSAVRILYNEFPTDLTTESIVRTIDAPKPFPSGSTRKIDLFEKKQAYNIVTSVPQKSTTDVLHSEKLMAVRFGGFLKYLLDFEPTNQTLQEFSDAEYSPQYDFEGFLDALRVQLGLFVKFAGPVNEVEDAQISQLREQGNNLMSNSAYAQAIQVYTEAIVSVSLKTRAHLSQLLTNRAIAYIGLNCFPEAIDDLNKAVHFDRTFTPAWTQLGYCHLYMGSSLDALDSYVLALKSTVGELLPPEDVDEAEYQEMKSKAVLPQFVQRLSQSISLTEKRAYQQAEQPSVIREKISEVRRILSGLRSRALETDLEYYTYYPHLRRSVMRDMSERANRSHPNILSPEVSQNMLASNGMEPITVSYPDPFSFGNRPPTARNGDRARDGVNRSTGTEGRNPAHPVRTSGGIQDILNDFGDFIETRAGGPGTPPGPPPNANGNPERGGNVFSEVFRGVYPEGITNIISQFTNGQAGSRVFVNGREVNQPQTQTTTTNTNRTANAPRERQPGNDEDETMGLGDDLD